VSTLSSFSGFIILLQNGGSICFRATEVPHLKDFYKYEDLHVKLLTYWNGNDLDDHMQHNRRVHKQIYHHIDKVQGILGLERTRTEINYLTKISVFYIFVYSLSWIPFGIMRGLLLAFRTTVAVIPCIYILSYHLSCTPFSILPYLYIMSDKKAKVQFFSLWKNKLLQVHPQVIDVRKENSVPNIRRCQLEQSD
jgi:hypothetical protein